MTERERILARAAARRFAFRLKADGWAERIPEDWEAMTDEQIKYAIEQLPLMGVKRRSDMRWERA